MPLTRDTRTHTAVGMNTDEFLLENVHERTAALYMTGVCHLHSLIRRVCHRECFLCTDTHHKGLCGGIIDGTWLLKSCCIINSSVFFPCGYLTSL